MKKYSNWLLFFSRLGLYQWSILIVGYFLIRMIFGLSYGLIYGYIALLFFLKIKVENMLLLFFSFTLITYVTGQEVEANHYMSFVFGFMVLTLAMHAWDSFTPFRKKHT